MIKENPGSTKSRILLFLFVSEQHGPNNLRQKDELSIQGNF